MDTSALLARAQARPLAPWPAGPAITRVSPDSRAVGPGALFVALPGLKADGHDYLAQAQAAGASGLVVSSAWAEARPGALAALTAPVAVAEDPKAALAALAAALAGSPSQRLAVVAVTGTNGKTTVTHLVRHVLEAAGRPTGTVGTLGARFGAAVAETGFTTPQAHQLQPMLARMLEAGAEAVVMEASSIAIAEKRLWQTAVSVAIFTNLTQDHLDYHRTMAAYGEAKAKLFSWGATGAPPRAAVVNLDDPYASTILSHATGEVLTYGVEAGPAALLWASGVETYPTGSRFTVHWRGGRYPVALPLAGRFNVENALAAFGAALALGLAPGAIADALASASGVPGRAEVVSPPGHPFTVWVDYAHTPDGLENVLRSARALGPARVGVVFGCGGDRDRAKRPLMGAVASALADVVVLTSDNPRSEDPLAIMAEVEAGMPAPPALAEPDRAEAIARALGPLARAGDVWVLAGKGHETNQTFADRTIPFDDREHARAALARPREGAR